MIDFINDQGSFVRAHLQSLLPDTKADLLRQLGEFVLYIIEGMELVQAERDTNNLPAAKVAPPVMPSQLVDIHPREFDEEIIGPRREQLSKFWDSNQIEAVEREHRTLCKANLVSEQVRSVLQSENFETKFNDGWDSLQMAASPKTYSHLRQFCCSLATVFANTASVESEFSTLKWELDDRRTGLTSLALEGIFQAKQFELLRKL